MSDDDPLLDGFKTPFWRFLLSREMRTALDAKDAARRAESGLSYVQGQTIVRAENVELRVAQLETQVAALALYARTILQLALDKGVFGGEEFTKRMGDLDQLDGKLDGR